MPKCHYIWRTHCHFETGYPPSLYTAYRIWPPPARLFIHSASLIQRRETQAPGREDTMQCRSSDWYGSAVSAVSAVKCSECSEVKCTLVQLSVMQFIAVYWSCSAMQCTAVYVRAYQCIAVYCSILMPIAVRCSALLCITIHCSALYCIAVHYSECQGIAVHFGTWQCIT